MMTTGIVNGRVLWSSTPLTFLPKEVVTRTFFSFRLSYIRRLTTAAVAAWNKSKAGVCVSFKPHQSFTPVGGYIRFVCVQTKRKKEVFLVFY